MLPVLLGNRGHGVVANPQCAGDCPLGVTSGECVDDALSNGEWAELCVMALGLAFRWLLFGSVMFKRTDYPDLSTNAKGLDNDHP